MRHLPLGHMTCSKRTESDAWLPQLLKGPCFARLECRANPPSTPSGLRKTLMLCMRKLTAPAWDTQPLPQHCAIGAGCLGLRDRHLYRYEERQADVFSGPPSLVQEAAVVQEVEVVQAVAS